MRRSPLCILLTLIVTASAYGQFQIPTQQTQPPEQAGEQKPAMAVTVLDAGQGEKHLLRYKFEKGASETMTMRMKMTMAMEMFGQRQPATTMPTIVMKARIDVQEVLDTGEARIAFEFTEVDVEVTDPSQQLMEAPMRANLETLVGMKGSYILSPQGLTRESSIELPENATPAAQQQMASMQQSLDQMSVPLPEEAVGANARWEISQDVNANPIRLKQKIVYTATEVSAGGFTAKVDLTQTADKQQLALPEAGGQAVTLESLKTTGAGSMSAAMNKLVPQSNIQIETASVISAEGMTMKQDMQMEMSIGDK